jgi:UDP-N-acetylglucosamine--N-acetylmuramyl-(pentapeptide) pyrophosphoryl-undecaprenol N-acetylglucosamine transferase
MTGKKLMQETKASYEAQKIDAQVVGFIDDMANAYAWADLVICRAGALTISELAAAGVASILIPYPHAVDDHQSKNAHYLIQVGAAVLLPQAQLNAHTLSELFSQLSDRSKLLNMSIAARQIAQPNATQQIVAACHLL